MGTPGEGEVKKVAGVGGGKKLKVGVRKPLRCKGLERDHGHE